ncbi:MAG: phosphomannomutase/phosphoglucomutase [Candidatus Pacebacteria bacterium]|nr:phosphomannomutase/phosphoglucomutase [Candidatus Paceibacterota bacterium]
MKIADTLPKEYKKAFKDADIRGVYPTQINEVTTYRTARAFVQHFGLKKVIVARDMRVSSPALRNAFVQGVTDAGAEAIDIGMVGTPAMYYASGTMKAHGVVITASHNPKEYNGLKLVLPGAVPVTNASGLKAILKLVERGTFAASKKKGRVTKTDVFPAYKKYVAGKVKVKSDRKVRVVMDAGNGMATTFKSVLTDTLPVTTKKLFFKLDGSFPNRDSNPTLKKNQKAIVAELKTGKYGFGVSFDGDVDRVAFFDEKGWYINSAVIGAMLAKYALQKKKGLPFVYTVFTSKIYEETIKQYGGKAVRARVGHAFIKEQMRKHDAFFGCEHSAHFYFKDNFYADSGILAFLQVLAAYTEAAKEGQTFSEMIAEFGVYHQTEEILVKVPDKKKALEKVAAKYGKMKSCTVKKFDGVTVTFKDYWFVVKQSVTEDALKFVVEAPEKELAEAKKKELHVFLKSM